MALLTSVEQHCHNKEQQPKDAAYGGAHCVGPPPIAPYVDKPKPCVNPSGHRQRVGSLRRRAT